MNDALNGVPPLAWTNDEGTAAVQDGGDTLVLRAAERTDWSNDALGAATQHGATALAFPAPASFCLSARAAVTSERTTFDAAALALWGDSDHWAKLCFEYSPQGQAMVVSVVTNGYSDDCNSTVIPEPSVFLRVTRVGAAWAFHASSDGIEWNFVRLFRLDFSGPISVGFLAQAPFGTTCEAVFDRIVYTSEIPADLRNGS